MVERVQALDASAEMEPLSGAVTISLPVSELWELFQRPHIWPRWNRCFYRVRNTSLVEGDRLRWMFHPIRGRYLYK